MATVRVSGFSVKPKDYVDPKQLDDPSADSQLKAWMASIYAVSSYSYLKELNDFIVTFFNNDSQEVMRDSKHLLALLRAYARIQTGFHCPVSGDDLIQLYEEPTTREAFAKQLWQSHFKQVPDERVWNKAFAEIDAAKQKRGEAGILAAAFGIASDPRSKDYRLVCFIAKLLIESRRASFNLADFFAVQTGGVVLTLLQRMILGLLNKNRERIYHAIKAANQELIEQFVVDAQRSGIQIEDAQGEVTHYDFRLRNNSDGSNNEYFNLIRCFLKEKGLTEVEMGYIFSTFHQAGWPSAMMDQLQGEQRCIHPVTLLRVVYNPQGQPEQVVTRLQLCDRGMREGAGQEAVGVFSVEVALRKANGGISNKKYRSQNVLPGLVWQQHQNVVLHYQALTPRGFVDVPMQLPAEKTVLKVEEIRLRLEQVANEKSSLRIKIEQAKNALKPQQRHVDKLRRLLAVLDPSLEQARRNGWRRTLFYTVMAIIGVGICAFILGFGLLGMGVLTSAALAYGAIAGGGTGLGGLAGYWLGRREAKQTYLKLETEQREKKKSTIEEAEKMLQYKQEEVSSRERYCRQLEQEEVKLSKQQSRAEERQEISEQKGKNQAEFLSATLPCKDESIRVTALNHDGVRVEFARAQLRAFAKKLSAEDKEMGADKDFALEKVVACEATFKLIRIVRGSQPDDRLLNRETMIKIISVYGTKKQYEDVKDLLALDYERMETASVLRAVPQFGGRATLKEEDHYAKEKESKEPIIVYA